MAIAQFSRDGKGFGLEALQKARATGLSDEQIRQRVAAAGLTLGPAAAQSISSQRQSTIAQFSGDGRGFGLTALQKARDAGLSDSTIRQQVSAAGLQLGSAAAQALGGGGQTAGTARPPANSIAQYSDDGQGFGLTALQRARAQSGLSDAEIRQQAVQSGMKIGPQADQEFFNSAVSDYQRNLERQLQEYKQQLDEGFQSRLDENLRTSQAQATQMQSQLSQSTSELQTKLSEAQRERDDAAAKATAYEEQRKAEQEMQVSQQLSSLRSGSTASGTAGPGLGSLSAGRSSYSVSTGGKRGSVLDRAYQDIDPTDSVLNKDVAVTSAVDARPANSAQRSSARQRALAAGGGASSYYARRFG